MMGGLFARPVAAPVVSQKEIDLAAEVHRLTAALSVSPTVRVAALHRRLEAVEKECAQLAEQNVQLRHALSLARRRAPGADSTSPPRTCPECHGPMQAGFAHYCPRRSTYDELLAS